MQKADIENIKNTIFEHNEIPDFYKDTYSSAARLTEADLAGMPDETKDVDALRRKLSEHFFTKLNNNYASLESRCDIKKDTFQKILRFRNGRNVTYRQLSKFCVGAKLCEAEARELFSYMGYYLDPKHYKEDCVLLLELKKGNDIHEYNEDLIELGLQGIYSADIKVKPED